MKLEVYDDRYHVLFTKEEVKDLRIIADLFGYSIDEIAKRSGCYLDVSYSVDWIIHRKWKIHEVIEAYLDYKYNKNVDDFRCEGTGSSISSIPK